MGEKFGKHCFRVLWYFSYESNVKIIIFFSIFLSGMQYEINQRYSVREASIWILNFDMKFNQMIRTHHEIFNCIVLFFDLQHFCIIVKINILMVAYWFLDLLKSQIFFLFWKIIAELLYSSSKYHFIWPWCGDSILNKLSQLGTERTPHGG